MDGRTDERTNERTDSDEGRGGGISKGHRIQEGDEGDEGGRGGEGRNGKRALPSVFLRTRSTAPEQPPQVMVMSKW